MVVPVGMVWVLGMLWDGRLEVSKLQYGEAETTGRQRGLYDEIIDWPLLERPSFGDLL